MMQDLHKEIVLDHYRRPRNRGELPGADLEEQLLNPLCGDEVTVYARVLGGRMTDVSFMGRGCAISQASASMLTERLAGKSLVKAETEIEAFLEMMRTEENGDLGELAALKAIITAPNRIRCATLAWTAFQWGLEDQ
jgi:nitrogen fixation protein NifU and related proteins